MKMTIKRITAFMLAAVTCLSISACGSKSSSAASAASVASASSAASVSAGSTPETSEVSQLVIDLVAEPTSMDPAHVTDINSYRVHGFIYDTLVQWSEDGFEMKPGLAESWSVSDDGLEYTFALKKGVKFHDGSDFNADAVVFTFERMLNPDHPYSQTGPFPRAKTNFGSVAKVEKLDDYTVKFTLSEPFAPFLNYMTSNTASIISPAAVEASGGNTSTADMGCGPYKLTGWDKGIAVTLTRFDEYYGEKQNVETVIIEPVVEALVRVAKLQTGEADIIADVDPDSIASLESAGFNIQQMTSPHLWFLVMNNSKAPFDNVKVRQAVSYAIDRDAIVNDILSGTGTAATQPLSPVANGYNKDIKGYNYDPEKAKQLLAEAGYPDGFTVKYLIPESGSGMQSSVAMSTAIQGYLSDIGITAEIEKMEWGTFLKAAKNDNEGANGNYDMWSFSRMDTAGDDSTIINQMFGSRYISNSNTGFYRNAEVDEMLDNALKESDPEKRSEIYRQAGAKIVEDAPIAFIDWGNQVCGVSSSISGFKMHPSQAFDVAHITKK